jgi:hypothetical protein
MNKKIMYTVKVDRKIRENNEFRLKNEFFVTRVAFIYLIEK